MGIEELWFLRGNRVSKTDTAGITRYIVDTNNNTGYSQVVLETDGIGDIVVGYVYGDDLISQSRGTNTFYYHYDGLGSTRNLTNSSGISTDSYWYYGFGDILSKTGITPNNYLFTGEQFDPNIGFYYLRARYYNTETGRFITADPIEGSIYDPVSLHKYFYCSNDPINRIDPSGEEFITTLTTIACILSFTAILQHQVIQKIHQDAIITIIVREAKIMVNLALHSLVNWTFSDQMKYKKWFGEISDIRKRYVTGCYTQIQKSLNSPIKFHRTWQRVYAYCFPFGPLEIWLGTLFFTAPNTGFNSKAGTLIHELSHEVCGTKDWEYGIEKCQILAIIDPWKAIDNADNYEYFAEDFQ